MKKLLMLGLSFMLLVSFSAFAKEGDAIVGKWSLISMEENGEVIEVDKLVEQLGEEMGKMMEEVFGNMFIEIDKDNNVVLMGDNELKGTVSEKDGKYSFEFLDEESKEKVEANGSIDKDVLTFEGDEFGKLKFKKK